MKLPIDTLIISNDDISHSSTPTRKIFSVSELNQHARVLLETHFATIWLEAEISNLTLPRSGHAYFSLKDDEACLRAAMFKNRQSQLNFKLADGLKVLVQGRISLYEPRGDYQFIVEKMEIAGVGDLQRKFEELKQKLLKAGLFDSAHKQPLPAFPRAVGIVTSATGAALHDILNVSQRRAPAIPIIVYPTLVQGSEAKLQIVRAIEIANEMARCDVLIVGRGGGSLEDLWPFNEECVAEAIFNSRIPIVSAVGHEIDFSIADFVADLRAPTPSAAAELVFPNQPEWLKQINHYTKQLSQIFLHQLANKQQQLLILRKSLKHPEQRLLEMMQRVDKIETHLGHWMTQFLKQHTHQLASQAMRLTKSSPLIPITQLQQTIQTLQQRLFHSVQQQIKKHQLVLAEQLGKLSAYDHHKILNQGYSLIRSADASSHLIASINDLQSNQAIVIELKDGTASAIIRETNSASHRQRPLLQSDEK